MTQNELYETINDLKNRSAYSPDSLFFSADVLKNLDEKTRKDTNYDDESFDDDGDDENDDDNDDDKDNDDGRQL